MAPTNPPFMTGVPELLCLRLLADEEMYGYELVRRIRCVTEEAVTLGEGVVYPTLHMLEKRRELKARREIVSGRPRIYYSVSAKGRRRSAAAGSALVERARWCGASSERCHPCGVSVNADDSWWLCCGLA